MVILNPGFLNRRSERRPLRVGITDHFGPSGSGYACGDRSAGPYGHNEPGSAVCSAADARLYGEPLFPKCTPMPSVRASLSTGCLFERLSVEQKDSFP